LPPRCAAAVLVDLTVPPPRCDRMDGHQTHNIEPQKNVDD